MSIGDITSDARGSGARFNTGKPPLEYVPMRSVRSACAMISVPHLPVILRSLEAFEAGNHAAIETALAAGQCHLLDAARVFEFGAQKYTCWNWAKGMAWSVPLACIKRHTLAIASGEIDDPESGLPHIGHIMCNVIMLHHFVEFYPEGADLPPAELFERAQGGEA